MNPEIAKVEPINNFKLIVTFDNNERKVFDVLPFIEKGGVFEELKNEKYFKKVFVSFGALAWPNNQDLSNDTVYLLSKESEITTPELNMMKKKQPA